MVASLTAADAEDAADPALIPPEDPEDSSGPERRCIVTRRSGPTLPLIRFALDPENRLVPDLAEKLPGRGFWLTAEAAVLERALKERAFNRAARRAVAVPPDLVLQIQRLLLRRIAETLALANRAGQVVAGFDKVADLLRRPERVVLRLEASDGARDGREKLDRLAPAVPVLSPLDAAGLGAVFGRDHVVHVGMIRPRGSPERGALAERLERDTLRLDGLSAAGTRISSGREQDSSG